MKPVTEATASAIITRGLASGRVVSLVDERENQSERETHPECYRRGCGEAILKFPQFVRRGGPVKTCRPHATEILTELENGNTDPFSRDPTVTLAKAM